MKLARRQVLSTGGAAALGWLCPFGTHVKALAAEAQRRPLLSDQDFSRIEAAIDRSLEFIVQHQGSDGGFLVYRTSGEPAITCLAVMAMLARGHQPGRGRYGERIERAVDYVLNCQHHDGMLAVERPEDAYVALGGSHCVHYNHGIAGLMLSEVYGMTTPERDQRIKEAINKALGYSVRAQVQDPVFDGSWGYDPPIDSGHITDLSVVSWNLMFLRSAKNIGFDVPMQTVKRTMDYVDRSYCPQDGGFRYHLHKPKSDVSVTGIGILMLSLGGERDSKKIKTAAEYLVSNPWAGMGTQSGNYGAYYIGLAALHLGEPYWSQIYPPLMSIILESQAADGSWPNGYDGDRFSPTYSNSIYTMTLAVPLQLLPIYQP